VESRASPPAAYCWTGETPVAPPLATSAGYWHLHFASYVDTGPQSSASTRNRGHRMVGKNTCSSTSSWIVAVSGRILPRCDFTKTISPTTISRTMSSRRPALHRIAAGLHALHHAWSTRRLLPRRIGRRLCISYLTIESGRDSDELRSGMDGTSWSDLSDVCPWNPKARDVRRGFEAREDWSIQRSVGWRECAGRVPGGFSRSPYGAQSFPACAECHDCEGQRRQEFVPTLKRTLRKIGPCCRGTRALGGRDTRPARV